MLFAAVHESLSGTKQSLRCSHRVSVVGGEAENIRSVRVFRILVESRCSAVALGKTYLLPPLSFGGASMVPPWLRFHIHRVAGGGRPPPAPTERGVRIWRVGRWNLTTGLSQIPA
jgi:hypothetical protein